MNEIVEKVNTVLKQYSQQLADNGIKLTASKRYFEASVGERIGKTENSAILSEIDRRMDRNKEKKKGYNHVRNKYHLIVLSVIPIKKDLVRREYCKDYAFIINKVERDHIGIEPKKYTYQEQKLLGKIEKRIKKICGKSQNNKPQRVCKDTLLDALRYTASKYGYKRKFLNIDRAVWELIFLLSSLALAVLVSVFIA